MAQLFKPPVNYRNNDALPCSSSELGHGAETPLRRLVSTLAYIAVVLILEWRNTDPICASVAPWASIAVAAE